MVWRVGWSGHNSVVYVGVLWYDLFTGILFAVAVVLETHRSRREALCSVRMRSRQITKGW